MEQSKIMDDEEIAKYLCRSSATNKLLGGNMNVWCKFHRFPTMILYCFMQVNMLATLLAKGFLQKYLVEIKGEGQTK